MTSIRNLLLSLILATGLAGCGGVPFFSDSEPAPVEEASGWAATPSDDGVAAITPYRQSPEFAATPAHSTAVEELLQTAHLQREEGNLAEAVATLERALRIEPRNAHLWNRLAHLRLDQQQPLLAAELAAKSNVLAAADPELKRDNWILIGQARRATGDFEGARSAERQAGMIY